MALVLGKSGRFLEEEAVRRRRRILTVALGAIGLLGALGGLSLGMALPNANMPEAATVLIWAVIILAVAAVGKWTLPKLDDLERGRFHFVRGAEGERSVGAVLERLPPEYRVINDVAVGTGNLDHVVAGPTGVFLLETKNWRGIVSPDGRGELLLNGRPLDRPYARQFVGRLMGVKDRVKALAPGLDPYFQPVFVFTSARVEAQWGKTGCVHCMTEQQVMDYIMNRKAGRKLAPGEVQQIAQAFAGLAQMEPAFLETRTAVLHGEVSDGLSSR